MLRQDYTATEIQWSNLPTKLSLISFQESHWVDILFLSNYYAQWDVIFYIMIYNAAMISIYTPHTCRTDNAYNTSATYTYYVNISLNNNNNTILCIPGFKLVIIHLYCASILSTLYHYIHNKKNNALLA